MSAHFDVVRRFAVEQQSVRGQYVRLGPAWLALREHADYPLAVRLALAQATAASVLLASTLKFDGELTLQMQGDGPLRLLVAQCTHDFHIRAVARFDRDRLGSLERADFAALLGLGQVVVTVEAEASSARYQGIVPLDGASLSAALERYFEQSEQLPTALSLAADDAGATGLLVQRMPQTGGIGSESSSELVQREAAAWDSFARARVALAGIGEDELLARPASELMQRAFPERDLRLFDAHPVTFRCRCSAERVTHVLRSLGREEVESILAEQGAVTITCEFCHRPWRFDAIDVPAVFGSAADSPPSSEVVN